VDIGDHVKKGALLAELDAPDLVKDMEQAQISLELAKIKVEQQGSHVEGAVLEQRSAELAIKNREAELTIAKAAQARWEQEVKRVTDLVAKGVVDQSILDEAVRQVQENKGRVDAAKAAVEIAKTDSELKQSRVALARATLKIEKLHLVSASVDVERAEGKLSYTHITAPFDGIVTTRNVSVGDFVSTNNTARMLRIIGTDRMRLVVNVPGKDAVHVRVGMTVSIVIDGKTITAKVARISSSLDEKTGTMRVEADVPNSEGHLLEGMYCRTSVNLGILKPNALTIPLSCLIEGGGPDAVFVAKDGKAVLTKIVGQIQGDIVEVYSGLNADDLVVANPQGLKNGAAVPLK
jgi:multidrug efflux pump subunit AcrA (membrane-fusion protein)